MFLKRRAPAENESQHSCNVWPTPSTDGRALQRLRIAPLSAAVVRVGEMIADPAAGIVSLDLSPVLLASAGEGCTVLDAVVFRDGTPAHPGATA